MRTINYKNTFILVSTDCPATAGIVPPKPGTIAAHQHGILSAAPYEYTSDELLVLVEARRKDVPRQGLDALRQALFSKPQACLRASPLVKSFGWGLHHNADCKVALVGCETPEYQMFLANPDIETAAGMRSKRVKSA